MITTVGLSLLLIVESSLSELGGYAVDAKGIHHLIPPAPLECDEGQVAYGFLTLYPATEGKNYMDFDWVGKLPIVRPEQWPTRLNFR